MHGSEGNVDVWWFDDRRVANRLTDDPASDSSPVWSWDDSHIVFSSSRKGPRALYQMPVRGRGSAELLLATEQSLVPTDMSHDGRFLVYRSTDPQMGYDIWALSMDSARRAFPVVRTGFEERGAQFSPDGQWIVYESNQSNRFEIYLRTFAEQGVEVKVSEVKVSTEGGAQPRWNPNGKELFYIALDGQLMSVPVRLPAAGQEPVVGLPVALFPTRMLGGAVQSVNNQQYAVNATGDRFLVNTLTGATAPITVIQNWNPKN